MTDSAQVDSRQCPLCGESNGCAMTQSPGHANESCWCRSVSIAEALLGRIAEPAQGRSCICQRCVIACSGEQPHKPAAQ